MRIEEIKNRIKSQYAQAGFNPIKSASESVLCYSNRFSKHFIFLFKDVSDLQQNREKLEELFNRDFLSSDNREDMYWNYYSIYVITSAAESNEVGKLRESLERDLNMSRKFLISGADINVLPPLYIKLDKGADDITNEFWEDGWRVKIGVQLYEKIITSSKSNMWNIVKEWLDAELNSNK